MGFVNNHDPHPCEKTAQIWIGAAQHHIQGLGRGKEQGRAAAASQFEVAGANGKAKPQPFGDNCFETAIHISGQGTGGDNIEDRFIGPGADDPFQTRGQHSLGFSGTGGGLENKVFMRQDRFNGLLLDGMQLPERTVKGAVGVGEVKDQVCGQGLSLSAGQPAEQIMN